MSKGRATVYIVKLAAGQRQLDAAIRMQFIGEDVLAAHTVAAAAFRLLYDIKKKRGYKGLAEDLRDSVLGFARSLVRGELREDEIRLMEQTDLWPLICKIAQQIATLGADKKLSEFRSLLDCRVPPDDERVYWSVWNRGANFLKHADADYGASLSLDELNTEALISGGCEAYLDLMGRLTPEMEVWKTLVLYVNSDLSPPKGGPFRAISEHLRQIEPQKRAKECAKLIKMLKRWYARAASKGERMPRLAVPPRL